jgi:hypothetical protein
LPVLTGYSPALGTVSGESESTGGSANGTEVEMPVSRPIKKLIVLVLAAGAVAVAVLSGAQAGAAGDTQRSAQIAHNQDNPNSMPPILARQSRSQLAALEAWEAVEFFSDPAPGARYSNAEMNAYGNVNK